MRAPGNREAIERASGLLGDLLGHESAELAALAPEGFDAELRAGQFRFLLEYTTSGAAASVGRALRHVKLARSRHASAAVPLVAVPYMGSVGRQLCADAGVSWIDLSGNAEITAPGLRIHVQGKPNRYKAPGRPRSAFAPKSSRIARWLLMHPDRPIIQRDLAAATGIDEGFTSKIVAKLQADALVQRDGNGAIRPVNPNLLLEAWGEDHDFTRHRLRRGHVPARSGTELMGRLNSALAGRGVEYAFTGLGAAWALTHFASFRLVTVYMEDTGVVSGMRDLGFRDEEAGANLWLVEPADIGVFQGGRLVEGAPCVHPVQVYLDLLAQPERGKEAAAELRRRELNWSVDA